MLRATPAILARSRWLSRLRFRIAARDVAGPPGSGAGSWEGRGVGGEAGTLGTVYDAINTRPMRCPAHVRVSSGLCIGVVLQLC